MSWTSQRKACGCGKLPHGTRRIFLRMRARRSARTSVCVLSLFMCEHSVRARSAGPAVRTRTRQCECTLTLFSYHVVFNFFSTANELYVTYLPNGTFRVTIGEQDHNVEGLLEEDGEKTRLICSIDGTTSKASVVLNNGSLHVFSSVSSLATLLLNIVISVWSGYGLHWAHALYVIRPSIT